MIRECVRMALRELVEVEAAEVIDAACYERSPDRSNERNGHQPRLLATQAGGIDLKIPELREGSFMSSVLEPRRRIDRAIRFWRYLRLAQGTRPAEATTPGATTP